MKIKYDIDKLKEIIDNLSSVIGVSMGIIDTKFNYIYTKAIPTDVVCIKIQSTKNGTAKCNCSDVAIAKKCAQEKKPVSHICHAGLLDTIVPVFKNDKITAYIVIGRVRPKENMGYIFDNPTKNDYGLTLDDYYKMPYLTTSQMESLIKLISHILFENSIEIDYGEFIVRVTDYIDKHLSENLSIENICNHFYVSKNYLYKSFRSFYNCTINEYITNQRIKIASSLLTETNLSTTLISEKVGIYNYTYFSRLFKKHTGLSPAKYRKLNK